MWDHYRPSASANNLLSFWTSVEYLLPQKAPNREPGEQIWDIFRDEELPWNDDQKLARLVKRFGPSEAASNESKPWAFTIYVGLVDMTSVSQELRVRFHESETEETKERDPSGECAVLCLKADGYGRIQPSANASEHWIPQHGEVAAKLLDRLLKRFGNARSPAGGYHVFVLSPFKSVAAQFKRIVCWPSTLNLVEMVGTVHTFQGKESDVVVLLLGCNPQRAGAIRFFAAAKPNLLNVAVKHRLYVIGDRTLWASAPYFKTLDGEIPKANPEEFFARFDTNLS
jgi:hypothetical protein